ncbi:uncharacterized protein N7483_012989 [Penicillium malachiteum]|uniref:uncharacterized protein n=1 Tax=Penicillium malachiteum TaxID=1324776 RepID=UPI0025479144|nr:uncharacterized protein N7483_012989 [Penicillium malachiteum]KAJ5715808.1 hypothetical protein N7483_012989 [Penicillium malachiteum]
MARSRYGCAICGYDIRWGRSDAVWLREFRAIYSTADGYFISGVGHFKFQSENSFRAPIDPTNRYDDDDYDSQLTEDFDIYKNRRNRTLCDVYATHDACWSLLQEAMKPNEISPQRFVDICESLPLAALFCPFWGHNFGGIFDFDLNSGYPWERQLEKNLSKSEASLHVMEDPGSIPEIPEILAKTVQESSNTTSVRLIVQMVVEPKDCFSIFPWEIREMIAKKLPTSDALNLRSSSRSFYPLLVSPAFWASRFEVGIDRAFLVEKRNVAETRDWLALYRNTTYSQSPPGLKNRRRIWDLIENIVPLLSLSSIEGSEHGSTNALDHETSDESVLVLAEANILTKSERDRSGVRAAEISTTKYFQNQGCRVFQKQYTSLPKDLTSLALSFVRLGDSGYLCGIRVTSQDSKGIQLGYHSEDTLIFNVDKRLRGFILAIHSQGVRAIQVLDGNGKSEWLGFPKDTPVTERLAVENIEEVQVGIDWGILATDDAKFASI